MGTLIDQHYREVRERALLFSFTIKVNLALVQDEEDFYFSGDYDISGIVNVSGQIDPRGPITGDCEERVELNSGNVIQYRVENWSYEDGEVACTLSVEAEYQALGKKRRVVIFESVQYAGELTS
ncbi:MAG: hypothetical protein AAF065_08040 [Verrucomicrobiota bacterium]